MKYQREREENVNCSVKSCNRYDPDFTQNCSMTVSGENHSLICVEYVPEGRRMNEQKTDELKELINSAVECADFALGDSEPDDLDEYLDYPDELAREHPLVFIFQRLQDMRELLS